MLHSRSSKCLSNNGIAPSQNRPTTRAPRCKPSCPQLRANTSPCCGSHLSMRIAPRATTMQRHGQQAPRVRVSTNNNGRQHRSTIPSHSLRIQCIAASYVCAASNRQSNHSRTPSRRLIPRHCHNQNGCNARSHHRPHTTLPDMGGTTCSLPCHALARVLPNVRAHMTKPRVVGTGLSIVSCWVNVNTSNGFRCATATTILEQFHGKFCHVYDNVEQQTHPPQTDCIPSRECHAINLLVGLLSTAIIWA